MAWHCSKLRSHEMPLFSMSLEEWLMHCDAGSGRLGRYRLALEQNFDSVEQVSALYNLRDHSGASRGLADEFFEALGVSSLEDRDLFQAPFLRFVEDANSKTCLREATIGDLGCERHAAPGKAVAGDTKSTAMVDLEDWLLEVDGSGEVARKYLEVMEELYDTPSQIVRLYSEHVEGSTSWSAQFFEDAGIDEAHQPLFSRWLAASRAGGPPALRQEHKASCAGINPSDATGHGGGAVAAQSPYTAMAGISGHSVPNGHATPCAALLTSRKEQVAFEAVD